MTAIWNGYKITAEGAEEAIDKVAAVAASTAADLEELSTAMSKVASIANTLGVDLDQMNAILSTVVSVTRQAPEAVGTSYKTILSRMADLKLDGQDEEGFTLGDVSGQLSGIGIQILDRTGELRDMGKVIEEVGAKWETWTRAQRQAAAVAIGGKRQANSVVALFDNWDKYLDALETSRGALGTLQDQQDIFLESSKAYSNRLKASLEGWKESLADEETIKTFLSGLTKIITGVDKVTEAFQGTHNILLSIVGLSGRLFHRQFGELIGNALNNRDTHRRNLLEEQDAARVSRLMKEQGLNENSVAINNLISNRERIRGLHGVLNDEKIKAIEEMVAKQFQAEAARSAVGRRAIELEARLRSYGVKGATLGGSQPVDLVDLNPDDVDQMRKLVKHLSEVDQNALKAKGALAGLKAELSELRTRIDVYDEETIADTRNKRVGAYNQELFTDYLGNLRKDELKTKQTKNFINKGLKGVFDITQDPRVSDSFKSQINEAVRYAFNGKNLSDLLKFSPTGYPGDFKAGVWPEIKQRLVEGRNSGDEAFVRRLGYLSEAVSEAAKSILKSGEELERDIKKEFPGKEAGAPTEVDVADRDAYLSRKVVDQALSEGERQEKIMHTISAITGLASFVGVLDSVTASMLELGDGTLETGEKVQKLMSLFAMLAFQAPILIGGFNGATALLQKFGFAATAASGALAGLIGVFALVGIAISAFVRDQKLAQEELAQTIAESKEALQDQAQIDALGENYDRLLKSYKETGLGKEDLGKATIELAEALGLELSAVEKLGQSYDSLSVKIATARLEKNREALETASKGARDVDFQRAQEFKKAQVEIKAGFFDAEAARELTKELFQFVDSNTRLQELGITARSREGDLRSKRSGTESGILLRGIETTEDAIALIEEADKFLRDIEKRDDFKKIRNTGTYSNLRTELRSLEKITKEYSNFIDQVNEQALNVAILEGDISGANAERAVKTISDFGTYRDTLLAEMRRVIEDQGITFDEKEAKKLVDRNLSSRGGEIGRLAAESTAKESLGQVKALSKGDVNEIFDELKESGRADILASIKFDPDATKDEVKQVIDLAQAEFERQSALLNVNLFKKATESISEKGDLSELKEKDAERFNEYLATREGIEGATSALVEFNEKRREGTMAQIQYLYDLSVAEGELYQKQTLNRQESLLGEKQLLEAQKANLMERIAGIEAVLEKHKELKDTQAASGQVIQDDKTYNDLANDLKEATAEANALDGQIEKIAETLRETDWDIDITNDITDSILTMGELFIDEADRMRLAAEKIGEGFKVAFEDSKVLFDLYPALHENAKVLSDGQIQLAKDTVAAVLGEEQALLLMDKEKAISSIDSQIAQLEAKKIAAKAKLDIAKRLAKGELELNKDLARKMGLTEEEITKYKLGLKVQDDKADAEATGVKSKRLKRFSDKVKESAEKMVRNFSGAASASAESMKRNSSNMITSLWNIGKQAAASALSVLGLGQGKSINPGKFSAGGGGTGPTTFDSVTMDEMSDLLSFTPQGIETPKFDELINDIELDIQNFDAQIDQLEALKLRMQASEKAAQSALTGAKTGAGGKKGKGGGKGKDSKKQEIDKIKSEADAYHDVNIELKQHETIMKRLKRDEQKLTGAALIDNLNKQLEVLEKQRKTQEKKLVIARKELAAYQKLLALKGVAFNEDGTIANYYEAVQKQLNEVNKTIAWFNALTAEAQKDDKNKKKVEDAKKNYQEFLKIVGNYDKLVTETIPSIEDDIQESLDKQIEINIKKFNMKIEIELELGKAERDWNGFKRKVIDQIKEDNILGNAQASIHDFLSYYKPGGGGSIQNLTSHLNDLMGQIRSGGGVYGDNSAKSLEDLKKYYTELMSQLESVEDLIDKIKKSQLEAMDQVSQKLQEQVNLYNTVSSLIQHDMNVIKIVYGKDAFEELDKFFDKQSKNLSKLVDFNRRQVGLWKREMDLAQAQGNKEAFEKAKEKWLEAVNQWKASVTEAVENIQNKYLNAIDLVFKKLNDRVTKGKGLDYVVQEWDLINKKADQYLDTVNATYGIRDLEQKYLKSIGEIDKTSEQQKLNDLMKEEIAALKSKEKLTQYDIDRANLRYQIALKQIALENAQKNKNKLRSRRNSQGNYEYERVPDFDEVDKLQNEINKLKADLYNLDKNQYKSNLNALLDVWREFQEKMAEAAKINDPKKRAERELLIQKQYSEIINGLTSQNEDIRKNLHQSAFDALAEMYDKNVRDFSKMTEDQKNIFLGEMIPQWNSGVQEMANVFAGPHGFTEICKDAMKDLDGVTKDFEGALKDLEGSAGYTFDSLRRGIDDAIDRTKDLITENSEVINSYERELDAIRQVIRELDNLISQFEQARRAAIEAAKAAYELWQMEQRSQSESNRESSPRPQPPPVRPPSPGSGSGGGRPQKPPSSKNRGNSNSGFYVGGWVIYTGGRYFHDSEGMAPAGSRGPGKKVKITKIVPGAMFPYHVESSDSAFGWLKKHQLKAFDTGGYTGKWGKDGKLALLHQKELVLNAKDTENLLDSVKIMRAFGDTMLKDLKGVALGGSVFGGSKDSIEQKVEIEANFPNVTSHTEIETALTNIVNVAAQRAMKR